MTIETRFTEFAKTAGFDVTTPEDGILVLTNEQSARYNTKFVMGFKHAEYVPMHAMITVVDEIGEDVAFSLQIEEFIAETITEQSHFDDVIEDLDLLDMTFAIRFDSSPSTTRFIRYINDAGIQMTGCLQHAYQVDLLTLISTLTDLVAVHGYGDESFSIIRI